MTKKIVVVWEWIKKIELAAADNDDIVVWTMEPNGCYSSKSAWDLIRQHHTAITFTFD